jgi:Arc/MetJ family transcription regulator
VAAFVARDANVTGRAEPSSDLTGPHVYTGSWRSQSQQPAQTGASCVVFKRVEDGRPYPDHASTGREWGQIPPRPVPLNQLVTTKNVLDLHTVLATDSTFYGDLFPHVISWHGELYLEDGLHRALRAALEQRSALHVRVLDLD